MLQKQINADITTELFIFNSVVPLRDVKWRCLPFPFP